jgi:ABC-type uncharacterized transport system permease subunit
VTVVDVVRENVPFIILGVAGGACWAVIMFTIRQRRQP